MQDDIAHSNVAAEAIQRDAGVRPQVGFNFVNGKLGVVTIYFDAVPGMPLKDIESLARRSVVAAFKREPDNLVLSFVFKRSA